MGFTDATDLQQMLTIPSLLGVAQTALSDFSNFPISTANVVQSPTDLLDDLSATLSADYATLVPVADTVNALLTSLPAYDLNLFTDQLEAGNPLAAVGDPIAADLALVPFALGYGAAAPVLEAAAGHADQPRGPDPGSLIALAAQVAYPSLRGSNVMTEIFRAGAGAARCAGSSRPGRSSFGDTRARQA